MLVILLRVRVQIWQHGDDYLISSTLQVRRTLGQDLNEYFPAL